MLRYTLGLGSVCFEAGSVNPVVLGMYFGYFLRTWAAEFVYTLTAHSSFMHQ